VLAFGGVEAAKGQADLLHTNASSPAGLTLETGQAGIWENGVGEGFRSSTQIFGFAAGASYGLTAFGSQVAHDLAIADLCYGHMLSGTMGNGHWYRGNLEFRLELFSGSEFAPTTDWFVGFTPHLRYNFATGSRLVPFFDAGAGVTATGIGPPDLSGTFEFNLQANCGVLWFVKDDLALSLEAGYMHWSCARISTPNLGLNVMKFMAGVSYYF